MTESKRITVSFPPETHALLREMAEVQETSMSKVVSDLVETLVPTLQRVVDAGRHFQALSEDMKDQIRRNFSDAEEVISPAVEALQADFLAMIDAVADGGNEEENPRRVTRGSRPSNLSTPTDSDDAPIEREN